LGLFLPGVFDPFSITPFLFSTKSLSMISAHGVYSPPKLGILSPIRSKLILLLSK
jgi:hypothetical protein